MDIASAILIVLGLILFEVVSSIDNAIVNAEVLSTMKEKARRWFLRWGIFFAVFVVRGMLPWLIVYAVMPSLGPLGALTATFSSDPIVIDAIEKSAPLLLMGGGVFLLFLFLHWLLVEEKNYGFIGEKFFHNHSAWFYAIASMTLLGVVWVALPKDPLLAFSAMIGSTAFFIMDGFKQNAEQTEKGLLKSGVSDVSKLMYLEVLDIAFSIDGVLGAFAFTLAVPLILIGNGIGAFVVREFTIRNIKRIKEYLYLKNGAMYSILILGCVMVLDGFSVHIPQWFSPVVTFVVIGYFFHKSKLALR
ncbi:MAG: DUF475 domain-containing protein [bacterium]|nr:DUF475 domain-containing protein [bacterium]